MDMGVAYCVAENRDGWVQGQRDQGDVDMISDGYRHKREDNWDNSSEEQTREMSNNPIGDMMEILGLALGWWRPRLVQCRECGNSGEYDGKIGSAKENMVVKMTQRGRMWQWITQLWPKLCIGGCDGKDGATFMVQKREWVRKAASALQWYDCGCFRGIVVRHQKYGDMKPYNLAENNVQ